MNKKSVRETSPSPFANVPSGSAGACVAPSVSSDPRAIPIWEAGGELGQVVDRLEAILARFADANSSLFGQDVALKEKPDKMGPGALHLLSLRINQLSHLADQLSAQVGILHEAVSG